MLRSDGTLWVNIGDSYCNSDKWGGGGANTGKHTRTPDGDVASWQHGVERLMTDPSLGPRLAQQAYADLVRNHTWDTRVRGIFAGLSLS